MRIAPGPNGQQATEADSLLPNGDSLLDPA
jgi:hypothetical protein